MYSKPNNNIKSHKYLILITILNFKYFKLIFYRNLFTYYI